MNIPDELLAAYVDGQLDGAARARIEQAILRDARLAQRAAQCRAARTRLRNAVDGVLPEAVSRHPLHTQPLRVSRVSAQIIDLARVRAERRRRSERRHVPPSHRVVIAASLLGGLLLGLSIARLATSGALTQYRGGTLLASGALAQALNTQLANSPMPDSKVHVGLSFKARNGSYCRTFSVNDSQLLTGLACHERNRWQILTLLGTQRDAGDTPSTRVAVANPPPMLLQAVRERIAGAPLDSQAEARARGEDWR